MKTDPPAAPQFHIYDDQARAAQIVRSWRDQFIKESNGVPLLLIVGSKVLMAEDILTNIAYAIDHAPRPETTLVTND
jgi:hypothetical protein